MTALLRTTRLEAGYGAIRVLWGVEIDVAENETVVLLGPNGAGKTTLLKCLVGLLPAQGGAIRFRGKDITRLPARARVRLGLSYMSELGIFPGLTVDENLRLGALFVDGRTARRRRDELYALFPILTEKRRQPGGSLSGGQRKMLGIAKALAAEPSRGCW
jgi:branched-chain amino acid transport system ATP-binding protein